MLNTGMTIDVKSSDKLDDLCKDIVLNNGEVYFVGGAVRDTIWDKIHGTTTKIKDYDIVVRLLESDQLVNILSKHGKVDLVGKSFAVYKVTLSNNEVIDVALPRFDKSTGPGHKDFEITFDPNANIEDDLLRRDFSINSIAIAYKLAALNWPFYSKSFVIVDPFNGIEDIKNKVIKTIREPNIVLKEDPLRILRAFSLQAKLGKDVIIDPILFDSITENVDLIKDLSFERISEELLKILNGKYGNIVIHNIFMWLPELLWNIIPEFKATDEFYQQNKNHLLNLDAHICVSVEYAIKHNKSLLVRIAALLHDIAKPQCFTIDENGQGHFYDHHTEGAKLARTILERIKITSSSLFPKNGIDDICNMIENHLMLNINLESSDKVLRKFIAKVGGIDNAIEITHLRECDKYAHKLEPCYEYFDKMRERLKNIYNPQMPLNPQTLAISGTYISNIFNINGRDIGTIKSYITNKVIEGDLKNDPEELADYISDNFFELTKLLEVSKIPTSV